MDTVAELMSTTAVTIPAGTRLVDARQEMARRQLDRLVVIDDDRIVGIISKTLLRKRALPTD